MNYTGHVDSDYANSLEDMRSVTEYVNFLAEGPVTLQSHTQASVLLYSMEAKYMASVTLQSHTQASVALSSMEAKYMALAAEVQQTDQQQRMFKELRLPVTTPTIIREDNNACQLVAVHPGNFGTTKHIDFRYHFVRERIQQGNVRVDYIPTSKSVADIFT